MDCFLCGKKLPDLAGICRPCWDRTKHLPPDIMLVMYPDGSTNQPDDEDE